MLTKAIELSTVAFYEGRVPRSIALKDCSWPLVGPVSTGMCGVYGTKSKPMAFMAARAYAERNRLNFTVIDYVIALENKPHPSVMKPQELSSYDFFSLLRMSKPMGDLVAAWMEEGDPASGRRAERPQSLKAEHVLMQEPSLIDVLAAAPACSHVKLFAFPAMTAIGDHALNIGFVPFRHWASIQEATCRLDPTVHVTLDPPAPAEKAKPTGRRGRTSQPRAK